VALYIGMSLFGNAWAVTAVTTAPQSKLNILKKVLTLHLVFQYFVHFYLVVRCSNISSILLYIGYMSC
jgi:hypothetical protein